MVAAPLLSLAFLRRRGRWAEVVADDYMRLRWAGRWRRQFDLRLGYSFGRACGVGAGADGFCRTAYGFAPVDAAFVMPTLVAGMGVLALFGAHGMLAAGWPGHAVAADLRQCFFNLPVLVRSAYQGFVRVPQAQFAPQRNRWARTRGGGLSGSNGRWCVMGRRRLGCLVFLYCFSGFRLALLSAANVLQQWKWGNLPAGGVWVGHGACVGVGMAGAGGYGGGRRFNTRIGASAWRWISRSPPCLRARRYRRGKNG